MAAITLFYIFITSLMIAMIMIPSVSKLSVRIGGIDRPDSRKVHSIEISRLGGIAIFCAFLFSVMFFIDINHQIKAFLAGAVVIFLTGLIDDLNGLSPRNKLIGEVLAASVAVVSGGISLISLGNPLGLGEIQLGLFSIPFTIFAVVGVMNAINLIDGLDGLAGGTSAVACLAFGVLSWKVGNLHLLALVIALLGTIIGFLRYNTYPAKIFMGDSGSLFLGYCMAFFSVLLLNSSVGKVSPVAPLMILGVPILDTLFVMSGRILCGKSISIPDKTHIHYRLLDLGFGHRFTVLLVYGLSYLLALAAIMLNRTHDSIQAAILVVFCIVLYSALHALSTSDTAQRFFLIKSDQELRQTNADRSLVKYSRILLMLMKYLILAILLLAVFVKPVYSESIAWGSGLLLMCMAGLLIVGSKWGSSLLQSVIYFSGLISVFIIENHGRQAGPAGSDLILLSHALFAILLAVVGIKVVLRNRAGNLMNSRFEYLILLVVIAVPLLPTDFTLKFHLMSVVAKSVVLFIAYKLILMRQIRSNRAILSVTFIALLAQILRHVFHQ